jgi:hypothetical protein
MVAVKRECTANRPTCDDDCGGHGTTYLYQNFPGPRMAAKSDDGTPMRNFYRALQSSGGAHLLPWHSPP